MHGHDVDDVLDTVLNTLHDVDDVLEQNWATEPMEPQTWDVEDEPQDPT